MPNLTDYAQTGSAFAGKSQEQEDADYAKANILTCSWCGAEFDKNVRRPRKSKSNPDSDSVFCSAACAAEGV